jgi:4'-phosphopantetheinyl transferase
MLLAPADIDVVVTRVAIDDDTVRACAAVLAASERRRAERFTHDRDRRRFIVRRAGLRRLLAERLDVPAESLRFSQAARGKPELSFPFDSAGLRFSLTHCEDLAVYALSTHADVGIDAEAIRDLPEADDIAALSFSPREYATYRRLPARDKPLGFLNCWTRKEAFVKATGGGLGERLDFFDVSLAPSEPARILRVNDRAGDDCGWTLASFSPAPRFVAALVTERPS